MPTVNKNLRQMILEHVRQGASLFDERYPGWFEQVDILRLTQSLASFHILAFVMPGVITYARTLGLDDTGVVEHGFRIDRAGLSSEQIRRRLEYQTEAWISVILDRRFELQR
jgi:hypothetical protein